MVKKIFDKYFFLLLIIPFIIFYSPFIFQGKIPMPLDTVVGLYHPYRDLYAPNYPNGIPYKNFLITDPVRQTFIWKELSTSIVKNLSVPSWNPYEMTGKPLIGNFQSGVFYPLNILLLIAHPYSWGIFIALQTILIGIFMYLYLKNLKLSRLSSLFGALSISFCAVTTVWLEWGNIIHTFLWIPLILLSIDKILINKANTFTKWHLLQIVFYCFSFFAGHLQVFFYIYILSICYFLTKWLKNSREIKKLLMFVAIHLSFVVITFVQWFPTLRFIFLSSRSIDQDFNKVEGWFIPFKHLIQFVSPDFFGNPTTLNYFGTWNYAEMIGFIGVVPLIFVIMALFNKSLNTVFYAIVILFCLLMVLPTGISSIPFVLNIPFLSAAQPTRLLFPISFSLCVLAAYGFERLYLNHKFKTIHIIPIVMLAVVYILLFILTKIDLGFFTNINDKNVAGRNLIFPIVIYISAVTLIVVSQFARHKRIRIVLFSLIMILSVVELIRFSQKFTPFVVTQYLYPNTRIIDYLKNDNDIYRVAMSDNRILPPNFLTHYKIQTIEGYDPLYLFSYGEYIASMERGVPNGNPPFGFNRIITPTNYSSQMFDFLNVKYVLSLSPLKSEKLEEVMVEGATHLYRNLEYYPRAYFVNRVIKTDDAIAQIFKSDLRNDAIISKSNANLPQSITVGIVKITKYTENEIYMKTINVGSGFLVLSDSFYPTWSAYIDGTKTEIFKTNQAFRGIVVPKGEHTILFRNSLF